MSRPKTTSKKIKSRLKKERKKTKPRSKLLEKGESQI